MDQFQQAWTVICQDDEKTSRLLLLQCLYFIGKNPSKKIMNTYCKGRKDFTISDLRTLANQIPSYSPTDLKNAFALLDVDNSGTLTWNELETALCKGTENTEHMTKSELDEIIKEFDANGDGKLTYEEFCNMLDSLHDEIHHLKAKEKKVTATKRHTTREKKHHHTDSKHKSHHHYHHHHHHGDEEDLKKDVFYAKDRSNHVPEMGSSRPSSRKHNNKRGTEKSARDKSDRRDNSNKKGYRDSPELVQAKEREDAKEPSNIQEWDCDRLHGTFQVDEIHTIYNEHYSFTVTETCDMYICLRKKPGKLVGIIDATLFLLEIDFASEEGPRVIAYSNTHFQKDPSIRMKLKAGTYFILPWSSGCKLKKREGKPKKLVSLMKKKKGKYILSNEAANALKEVFRRIDLDGRGSLGRAEYDLLFDRTEGEPCDDATWEHMQNSFHTDSGELTEQGFLELYTQGLELVNGDAEAFYENFANLGYNRQLELDEACPFTLFLFSKTSNAIRDLIGMPYDGDRLNEALISTIVEDGRTKKVEEQLSVTSVHTSARHSYLVENSSRQDCTVVAKVTANENACFSSARGTNTVEIPGKESMVVMHCMPEDPLKPWSADCSIKALL